MKFELYTDAALARDLPENGLCAGDVVKIVDHYPMGEAADYSIEVFNALGDTITMTCEPKFRLEPLLSNEAFSERRLTAA